MRNVLHLCIFAIFALFCSGFTWGKTKGQSCNDANKLVINQQAHAPDVISGELENKVTRLCPDGVAKKFLSGLKYELLNQPDRAVPLYENIIQIDEHFPDSYGRLGLLQLSRNDKPAAMVSLTRALENGGKNSRYHEALAELLLETGAYPLALYHFEQAHQLGRPHDVSSLVGMSRAYSGIKNWKDAESSLRQALQLSPQKPELTSELAGIVIRQQRLIEGIQLVRQAIESRKDDKSLHRQLADALNASGDIEAAKAELLLAGIVTTNPTKSHSQEGDAFLLRRDFPAAIRCYKEALEKNPTPELYQKLGDAYLAVGNDDDALKNYQKSLSIAPEDAGVYYSVGVILERKGDISAAIGEYERCISLDKNNGDAHRRLAEIYVLNGKIGKALTEYNTILTLAPDNPVIHFKLAKAYEKAGKLDDFMKSLEHAIKLDPSNLEPRRELVKLEIRRKDFSNAEKHCREILTLNRDDSQERKRLIGILVQEKKYDELVNFLTEESLRYPDDNNPSYRLGLVKEYLKDYPAAIKLFLKSIKITPTAQSYYALARTYLRTADTKKAREALNEANKLDPKRKDTRELIEILDQDNVRTQIKIPHKKHGKKMKKSAKGARKNKKHDKKTKKPAKGARKNKK